MKKLITVCVLSFFAFINATYLTIQNDKIESLNKTGSSFCDINNSLSCTNVLSSPYSKIFNMPFTGIAMIVYPIIFIIALLGISKIVKKPFHILATMGILGIMFNSYFILQEFLYIKSYCPLCMVCSLIIILIFILSINGIYNPIKEEKTLTFFGKIKKGLKITK